MLFPSHAPSIWTGSPSLAMCRLLGISVSFSPSFLMVMMVSHWVLLPNGIISVFSVEQAQSIFYTIQQYSNLTK